MYSNRRASQMLAEYQAQQAQQAAEAETAEQPEPEPEGPRTPRPDPSQGARPMSARDRQGHFKTASREELRTELAKYGVKLR